jgi:Chaperone of endosialidase
MKKHLVLFLFLSMNVFAQTGIGTTTPVNKFQVEATTANPSSTGSSTNGNLRISGSGASHVLDFGLSSSSTFAWLQARSKSNYATLYDLAFNPNGGKVGIGTSAPSATLTVGNEGGTIGGEILLNPTSTQYEGGQIIFKKSLQGSTVDWTLDQYGTTSANARFRIFNGASETNGISILENGNVGLGTAIPTARLNLDGGGMRIFAGFGNNTSRPSLNTSSIGNYEIRGVGAGGGSTQGDGADDGFLRLSAGGGTNSNTQASIDLSGYSNVADMGSNILFRTAGSERLRINADGKMGIGTSSPSATFHIQNANTTGAADPASNSLPSIYLYNTNSASTSANSILALRTNGSAGGNPFVSFDISGIRGYSMGIDNGDADKFKIIPNWNFTSLNVPILTVDNDSRVGIGTASPSRRLHVQSSDNTSVYIESTTSDNNGMMVLNANTNQYWGNGYHEFIMFQRQGTTIGQITAPNESSVNYATTSDYRLKKDLKPFKGLELINRLKTYDFAWKINDSRMYGFMAHELQDVLPYLVTGQKDAVDSTGKILPQTVDYSKLTPILVKAIQEQDETINNLKKDKEQLEQTLKDIQERLLKLENKK